MMRKTIFTSRTSEAGAGGDWCDQTKPSSFASKSGLTMSAVVLAVLLACTPGVSQALSLGKVQVQSALGEPMLAEIDLTEVKADEAASLSATIAAPDVFKSMGVDYNAALTSTRVTVAKRANGNPYLKISSDRPVNDPFVDMIVEVTWPAGRLVRDFTLLFDPRNLMPAAAVQPQLPVTTGGASQSAPPLSSLPGTPASAAPIKATVTSTPSAPAASASAKPASSSKSKPKGEVSAKVAPATDKPTPQKTAPDSTKNITVKEGDTASKIAQRNLAGNVSLDQMLAAMLRSNPDAFINGDINRIKAGAVIETPDAAAASQIKPEEARQVLVASARNFGQYKQRAAQLAPAQTTEQPARQSTGKVEAKVVEDKKAAANSPDKLKLAKGSVQGSQAAAAQSVAQAKQSADTRERAAEVSKNMADLAKISAAAGLSTKAAPAPAPAPTPAPAASTAKPGAIAPTTPPATPAPTTSPAASAAVPAPASSAASAAAPAPAPAASAKAAPAPKPIAKAPPPPPPEPSFIDSLTENPLVPAGAAGLIAALLGGFAFWRRKQAKTQAVDSSFLESRLQPDSFFGASGGQMVNTQDQAPITGSSMIYSPSQLDAAGDVDPVAEAEVYMAYGRDLQAEEILKEALRIHGSRISIHVKLLEIYAKRRDAKAFELVAKEVYELCHGDGPDWEHACNLGRALDPTSPLYQPGGKPSDIDAPSITQAGVGAASFAASTMPQQIDVNKVASSSPASAPEIDLDLDLDIFGDAPPAAPETGKPASSDGLDFDIEPTVAIQVQTPKESPAPTPPEPMFSLDLEPPSVETPAVDAAAPLEFSLDDFSSAPTASAEPAGLSPAPDPNALSFDLGSLSLDLPALGAAPEEIVEEDPMNTKLELATEFFALGDVDGARAIAEEVANEASGGIKAKAQKLLSQWQ